MAHVAQALFISFVVTAVALLLVRGGGVVVRVLYTRPLALWMATAVVIPAGLILTGRWRIVDWGGVAHFIIVAVVAFTGLAIVCEIFGILKRLIDTRR